MNKKELIERNEILETQVADLEKQLITIANEAYTNGEHLKIAPFIPEYLGFTETVLTDDDDIVTARVYTKAGFNIAKPVDVSKPFWVILGAGKSTELVMDNMYDAIIVLRACGMEVSLEDYFEHNSKEAQLLEEKEAALEEELKELEKGME